MGSPICLCSPHSPPRRPRQEEHDGDALGVLKMGGIVYTPEQGEFYDRRRPRSLLWLNVMEKAGLEVAELPPPFVVMFPEILEKGWGWQRLVPYCPDSVDWPDFKRYLEKYFTKNLGKASALCAEYKPAEPVGQGAASEYNELCAAANMCIEVENNFFATFAEVLTLEEMCQSTLIRNRARQLIQSKNASPVAIAGLLCITKESEMLSKLCICQFNLADVLELSLKIRNSASNLMLYKGSEFASATAGAMLGMVEEAMIFADLLSLNDSDLYMEQLMCDDIRRQTALLFTKLEEFACKGADNADVGSATASATSEKPTGEESKAEVGGMEEELKEKRELKNIGNGGKAQLDSCKDLEGKILLTSEQLEEPTALLVCDNKGDIDLSQQCNDFNVMDWHANGRVASGGPDESLFYKMKCGQLVPAQALSQDYEEARNCVQKAVNKVFEGLEIRDGRIAKAKGVALAGLAQIRSGREMTQEQFRSCMEGVIAALEYEV